jgi:hypothetical protein
MKFLAMIYGDREAFEAKTADEQAAIYAEYRAFADAARTQNALVDGAELAPTSTATTVRVRDGETLVNDGPFAETKEALGGYFLLRCDSIDEAVEIAARIPGADRGAVEVRACHVDEEAPE